MTTLAIVSQKGGSGKTTLAVHVAAAAAAAGKVAVIIDTDPQATAAAWGDWRGGAEPEVITSPPSRLPGSSGPRLSSSTRRRTPTPPHARL